MFVAPRFLLVAVLISLSRMLMMNMMVCLEFGVLGFRVWGPGCLQVASDRIYAYLNGRIPLAHNSIMATVIGPTS